MRARSIGTRIATPPARKQVANALGALGVEPGDRVATLAWNGYRHLELYFAVSGMGAVCHTINPRLFPEQITYIVNHAEDRYLFFDLTFAAAGRGLEPALSPVKALRRMTDREHKPAVELRHLLCYEELARREDGDDYPWPEFDENTACALCYTSGTTGKPKGVLYSHRSTVLHTWAVCCPTRLGLSAHDWALLVVPCSTSTPGAPVCGGDGGAGSWCPGRASTEEPVRAHPRGAGDLRAGVPTVWLMLFDHVAATKVDPKRDLVPAAVVVGGAAAARSDVRDVRARYGASSSMPGA